MNEQGSTRRRRQLPRAIFVAAIVLLLASVAYAAVITITDDAGPDDFPGQKDLTQLTIDYAGLPNTLAVTWNWDDTDWPGANTGDACSLFDTDADGMANYSLCVTVGGSAAAIQTTQLYSCNDAWSDRCGVPQLVPDFNSACTAGVVLNSDPFASTASHRTGNTCSAIPGCYDNDTVAICSIQMTDFGNPSDAFLINVCSYPSAQPNSAPSECVVTPNDAFITVYKVTENLNGVPYCAGREFEFSMTGQTNFFLKSSLCAGTPSKTFTVPGGTYVIAEVDSDINQPNGWILEDVTCTGSGTGATPNDWTWEFPETQVSGSVNPGQTVICTFTNQQGSPLAVNIASFTAAAAPQGVTLGWETVSETGNAGFNVYRSTSDAGPWTQVNAALIPAKAPGSAEGQVYSWTDASAEAGTTYFYQLEDVALSGETTRHDPVSVTLMGPNAVGLAGFGAAATTSAPALAGLAGIALAALAGAGLRRRR